MDLVMFSGSPGGSDLGIVMMFALILTALIAGAVIYFLYKMSRGA